MPRLVESHPATFIPSLTVAAAVVDLIGPDSQQPVPDVERCLWFEPSKFQEDREDVTMYDVNVITAFSSSYTTSRGWREEEIQN